MGFKLKKIGSLLLAIALTFTLLEAPVLAAVQGAGEAVSTISGGEDYTKAIEDNKASLEKFEKTFTLEDYLSANVQDLTGKASAPSKIIAKNIDNIAVFVNFADYPSYVTDKARQAANKTYNGIDANSLSAFVAQSSYGNVNVKTTFYPANGEIVLDKPFAYYCKKTDKNPIGYDTNQERIKRETEIITYVANAISQEVTASGKKFDGSNISFIFPTNTKMTGVEFGELLWPHSAKVNTTDNTAAKPMLAGTAINTYNFVARGTDSVGVMATNEQTRTAKIVAQEFLRTLGMPSLKAIGKNTAPAGILDTLQGSYFISPLNALYQREYFNFAQPLEIEKEPGKKQITLQLPKYTNALEKNAIKLSIDGNAKEYFVIEARDQAASKATAANKKGLLVYRVNTAVNASIGNTGTQDYLYVMRPGETAFNAGNGDIDGAIIEPGESFGKPKDYSGAGFGETLYYANGTNSEIVIDNVIISGDTITFDLEIPQIIAETIPETPDADTSKPETPDADTSKPETPDADTSKPETPVIDNTPVIDKDAPVIDLTKLPNQLIEGDSGNFTTVLTDAGVGVKFASSDETVLSVKENGEYVAVKAGEANLLLTTGTDIAPSTVTHSIKIDAKPAEIIIKEGWTTEPDGKIYFIDALLTKVTGKQLIEDKWYLFNTDGSLRTSEGFAEDFYMNVDGTLATGITEIDGKLYGFSTDGTIFKVLFKLNDKNYLPDAENGFALHKSKVLLLDGALTAIDEHGVQVDYGWVTIGGKIYYQGKTYRVLTGEQNIDNSSWIFDENGILQIEQGLFDRKEGTYYKYDDGHLAKNEIVNLDGKLYGFDENGLMHKTRFLLNNNYYIPNPEDSFALFQSVIVDFENEKSAIDANAVQAVGIIEIDGKKYYQTVESGYKLLRGKQSINDKIYVFDNYGVMREKQGFVGVPEGAYYVNSDGSLATGIVIISSNKYGFTDEGLLYKDAFIFEGNRYVPSPLRGYSLRKNEVFKVGDGVSVVDENCVQVVDKIVTVDGKKYYQTVESGYTVVKGKQTIDGKMYVFDNFGVMKEKQGFVGVPEGAYYINQDGSLATGIVIISSNKYAFTDDGLLRKDKFTLDDKRYYPSPLKGYSLRKSEIFNFDGGKSAIDEECVQAVDKFITINGKQYYQTVASGYKLLTGKQTIGDEKFIFDNDGALNKDGGFIKTPQGTYYVQKDGSLAVGLLEVDQKKYGFANDGLMYEEMFEINGNRYFPNKNDAHALRKSEVFDFDGGKSAVDENCVQAVDKFITINGKQYYQTVASGYKLLTGQQTIGDKKYIFNTNGELKNTQGFVNTPEGAYYIMADGTLATGIVQISANDYGFTTAGILYKDAFVFEGNRYVPSPLRGYSLRKNEVFNVTGGKSFVDENGVQIVDKFVEINGKEYYQTVANGYKVLTGKQIINDKMYIFDKDGALNKTEGFVQTPQGIYYVKADGSLAKGFEKLGAKGSEKLYAFDDNNLLNEKEFTLNGKNYLPNSKDGYALFTDGIFMVDDVTKEHSIFDKDSARLDEGFISLGGSTYYQNAKTKYLVLKGYQKLENDNYYFDTQTGKQITGWAVVNGAHTYFNADTQPAGAEAIAPVMQVANSYDAKTQTFVVTINASFGNLGPAEKAFSFDGGANWQSSNTKVYDGKTNLTINAGQLMVKAAVPNNSTQEQQARYIVKNTNAINLIAPAIQGNRGIDVAKYQGSINWPSVASSGISFAIIKAVGCNKDGTYYIDPYFEQNVRNAKAAGIKVGAYIFSYANSIERVKREVDFFVNSAELNRILASGIKFDLPIYIDYEDNYQLAGTDYALRTEIVRTGMILLEKAGFYPGFYTYHSYINNFNVSSLVSQGYTFWYARYPAQPIPENRPSDIGTRVDIWQYCSDGNTNPEMKPYVNGITTSIDLNIMYEDLVGKVYKFYEDRGQGGGGGTIPPPVEQTLTVYDEKTTSVVSGTVKTILAQIVQAEVGPFGNIELYKAQAVAAHSWIQYQNFKGNSVPRVALAAPSDAVINAVAQVASELVMYENSIANTMYASANNTKTHSAQQMWGGSDTPYLTAGIASPHDVNATVSLSNKSPWFNKVTIISNERAKSNIEKLLGAGATNGRDPSTWLGAITTDAATGYVTSVEVCGVTIAGGKFYDNFYGLYSPSFTYQYNSNGTWTFTTQGNGHCVGMSQWGAYGFAINNAWSYSQILAHYYPNTTIKTN